MRFIVYIFLISLLSFFSFCKSKKNSGGKTSEKTEEVLVTQQQPDVVVGLNYGNKAPEIALKNYKDSLISLSSIKGKIVLIDFWASWCGPCRHENPNVVAAYTKYKNKKFKNGNGFTVYSVSLDVDKNRWKQAIDRDGLSWPYHVSDLKMWSSEVVQTYNILGIPTNVLINDQGIIIGKDLRAEALTEALEKIVVKE